MIPLTQLVLAGMSLFCLAGSVRAAPPHFDKNIEMPSLFQDDNKPRECTVTYLVTNITTNDTFAVRMRIAPANGDDASRDRFPCPSQLPPRVDERAIDACRAHEANPETCVFADMGRDFSADPQINATSESASRCASDLSAEIGIACWNNGRFDVCNVACGQSKEEAVLAARSRCEAKHRKTCPITGSLPVLAP